MFTAATVCPSANAPQCSYSDLRSGSRGSLVNTLQDFKQRAKALLKTQKVGSCEQALCNNDAIFFFFKNALKLTGASPGWYFSMINFKASKSGHFLLLYLHTCLEWNNKSL